MAELFQGRLLRVMLACISLYILARCTFSAPTLILIENGLLLSVSGGVTVAYAPIAWPSLRAPFPTRGHYLGLGIFLTWLSGFAARIMSIVARDFGHPQVLNTHWLTLTVAPMLLGGVLHLWAPNAVEGRIPRERWVLTGILVGIALFATFVMWSLHLSTNHPTFRLA